MAVELDSLSLDKLTQVLVHEHARVALHEVPGQQGSFSQTLGRSSVSIVLHGIFYGDSAADDLKKLRDVYLDQQPVDFFADAVGDGYFSQVLVTRLEVGQSAGRVDQFDYRCELVEYVVPPEPSPAGALAGLNDDILGEAQGFMDDVQNAIGAVSDLSALLGNAPSFADPTGQLTQMPDQYTALVSGDGLAALTNLRNLF